MFSKKEGFTLVELMVAVVLSAIVIFFSYTMTISAYKMFSKVSKTSNNFNSTLFFEEYFTRVFEDAYDINFSGSRIRCQRFDPNIKNGKKVKDDYSFEKKGGSGSIQFIKVNNDHFDSVIDPESIPDNGTADLIVRTPGAGLKIEDVVLLSNVRAFYYKVDTIGVGDAGEDHLRNITIGVVYDDYIVPGVPKRQFKTFCFALRNQRLVI
jgi:prepilin-type N-terminal cleavage/methylation domain-containing protein